MGAAAGVQARARDRVSRPLRVAVRLLRRWFGDAAERRRGRPLPPWSIRSRVPGDFRAVGREFLGYMVELGGLRPDDQVLDIGCRAGRLAIPLTGYLGSQARYEGVDTWAEGTDWCRRTLSSRYPNFHFQGLGLEPGRTAGRPGHHLEPEPLPYEDGRFDFAIVVSIVDSVPDAFGHYLAEAARTLKAGGTYFGTWFLRDGAGSGQVGAAPPIACAESEACDRLAAMGLIVESVYRGSWDGAAPSLTYQDLVIARKSR